MSSRLSKSKLNILLNRIFGENDVQSKTVNRHWVGQTPSQALIFVSQCKPSSASKGHWKYEFFHTIKLDTILEILDSHGRILLLDYIRFRYCLLSPADIGWVLRYSSRNKSNEGPVVDICVKEKLDQVYCLKPYDTLRREERLVSVVSIQGE